MPINVFPWPPVAAIGTEWTISQPIVRMRSGITGRTIKQASRPPRRLATVIVSSLGGRSRSGAGYSEMLKKALQGGVHGVRLRSSPINWWLDTFCMRQSGDADSDSMSWLTPGDLGTELGWTTPNDAGGDLVWITGPNEFVVDPVYTPLSTGGSMINVSGFPPGRLAVRAGDYVTIHKWDGLLAFQRVQVISDAFANSSGILTIRVTPEVTIVGGGLLKLAAQDEAVFEVIGDLPRAVQNVQGDWTYTWNFREIFSDEVGGFTERSSYWGDRYGPA